MNSYPRVLDALQDALIGRRLPALVVFRLQPVDRDHGIQLLEVLPMGRYHAKSARYHLGMNTPLLHLWQNLLEFPIAHQRITAHQ